MLAILWPAVNFLHSITLKSRLTLSIFEKLSDVNKESLIYHLKCKGYISSKEVEQAIKSVPREKFVPPKMVEYSYEDRPLSIGNGQTISAPHMVAIMAEALELKNDHKVLEIGTGSGYHAAVISHIVTKGHVYTVERIHALAEQARIMLEKLDISNVTVVESDGSFGLLEFSPYDRLYATCATPSIPQPFFNQLGKYGKMLIPVGNTHCNLMLFEKNDKIKSANLGACAFVPMIRKKGHNA